MGSEMCIRDRYLSDPGLPPYSAVPAVPQPTGRPAARPQGEQEYHNYQSDPGLADNIHQGQGPDFNMQQQRPANVGWGQSTVLQNPYHQSNSEQGPGATFGYQPQGQPAAPARPAMLQTAAGGAPGPGGTPHSSENGDSQSDSRVPGHGRDSHFNNDRRSVSPQPPSHHYSHQPNMQNIAAIDYNQTTNRSGQPVGPGLSSLPAQSRTQNNCPPGRSCLLYTSPSPRDS